MEQSFSARLAQIQQTTGSVLCAGLDPDPAKIPHQVTADRTVHEAVRSFLKEIMEATHPFVCAYKINFAFFEALGPEGYGVLSDIRSAIPEDRVVIADAKRGDIGNTARFYARSVFDHLQFDAITVNPYMGRDSVIPFLEWPGTASFVLVRTSNTGADDLQLIGSNEEALYEKVARLSCKWGRDRSGEIGFVVGATDTTALLELRKSYPDTPLLIPGIGAQGGSPRNVGLAIRAGRAPVIVNSSRSILYASNESDYADRAASEAARLNKSLSL